MNTKFEEGTIVYHNNEEVIFVCEINDRQSLIAIEICDPEGEWTDDQHLVVNSSSLHDKRVDPSAEIKAERLKVNTELAEIRKEINEIEKERDEKAEELKDAEDELNARLAKHEAIEHIFDYIDGKITHFVENRWSHSGIVAAEDSTCSYDKKSMKLLTLRGSSDGNLQWNLGNYSDDSGSHYESYPCRSYEEAREKLGWLTDKMITKANGHCRTEMLKACSEHNVTSPIIEKARQEASKLAKKHSEDNIASLKAKLAEAENAKIEE